jgi:hypothetical protein
MVDGTVIVGGVGIVTSGIVAPLITHHTQKVRDVLRRQAEAIDTALTAMTSARASETWLEQRVLRDSQAGTRESEHLDGVRDLVGQTHRLQTESVRLNVHLGNGPLVDRYVDASNAIARQSSALWRYVRGEILRERHPRSSRSRNTSGSAHGDVLDHARRWNEDETVAGPMHGSRLAASVHVAGHVIVAIEGRWPGLLLPISFLDQATARSP